MSPPYLVKLRCSNLSRDNVHAHIWFILQCYDTVGWVMWPVKSSPKWPTMCRVGRLTLLCMCISGSGL